MPKKLHRVATKNPEKAAHKAGLYYITDSVVGICRKHSGKQFIYVDPAGKIIRDKKVLQRIRALVIPPAWKDVWICPKPNGHLQATGRDAKGRKQYRYHNAWRVFRDHTKYDRMRAFGEALPKIRAQVKKDLARPALPREKIIATVIGVMEKTLIRIGNEEYAKENHSYGLTTLRENQIDISGATVRFRFKGKSGVHQDIALHDIRLAKIIRRCHELPGHELFDYVDKNGQPHAVGSADVNNYLKKISGEDFTAKDFRTWYGTILAAEALCTKKFNSAVQAKKNLISAIDDVAKRLGNTRAVCKKCYINPAILESYLNGSLLKNLNATHKKSPPAVLKKLHANEAAIISFLYHRV